MKLLPVIVTIAALLAPSLVLAHPETGLLPDAIAETEYRIVLEINPKDIQTRTKLAMVLYRKNKLKDAERELVETLKVAPRNFDAHDVMGLIRLKEKKSAEAIAWFQKAISIKSDDSMVYLGLGQALEESGRNSEAEAAYRKGLEVSENMLRKGLNREKEAERKNSLLSALQKAQNKKKPSR
ncbi:tetratricopeptide repeat protein [Pelotalea chapellei]|uniref:Tetratricopeptide repeat protein n=1 Tax=Pelotalea chapellei TaxID=44671 RepID=A0ABS5UBD2_9BACT|nr:tetratricopeptide repeat protein [Pelotalea chapellei]MBT1072966.1 tetratricopeptide repeat protein [Pelotalea chapellei]